MLIIASTITTMIPIIHHIALLLSAEILLLTVVCDYMPRQKKKLKLR